MSLSSKKVCGILVQSYQPSQNSNQQRTLGVGFVHGLAWSHPSTARAIVTEPVGYSAKVWTRDHDLEVGAGLHQLSLFNTRMLAGLVRLEGGRCQPSIAARMATSSSARALSVFGIAFVLLAIKNAPDLSRTWPAPSWGLQLSLPLFTTTKSMPWIPASPRRRDRGKQFPAGRITKLLAGDDVARGPIDLIDAQDCPQRRPRCACSWVEPVLCQNLRFESGDRLNLILKDAAWNHWR